MKSFNYYLENKRYVLIKLLFIGEVSCFCTVRKLRLLFYIIFFLIQVHCITQVTYLYCSKSIARLLFVFVFLWFCFRIQIVQRSLKKKLKIAKWRWAGPYTPMTHHSSDNSIQSICEHFSRNNSIRLLRFWGLKSVCISHRFFLIHLKSCVVHVVFTFYLFGSLNGTLKPSELERIQCLQTGKNYISELALIQMN